MIGKLVFQQKALEDYGNSSQNQGDCQDEECIQATIAYCQGKEYCNVCQAGASCISTECKEDGCNGTARKCMEGSIMGKKDKSAYGTKQEEGCL